ncbi:hypothetical protein MHBO_002210, partial [Bonamia ostreae]
SKNAKEKKVKNKNDQLLRESLLSRFSDTYDIDIIELDNNKTDEKYLQVLDEEGCPLCLYGKEKIFLNNRCVLFLCKLSDCFHVFHENCININLESLIRSSTSFSIKKFHSLSFLSVLPFSLPNSETDQTPRHVNTYLISVEMSHLISNSTSLKIDWPEPINSFIDPVSQKEFLMLSLEKISRNIDENEMSENLPMFRAKRGKIKFCCSLVDSDKTWIHEGNYDLYPNKEHFVLAHEDKETQNKLSLGLKKERLSEEITAFSMLFVHYEIGNNPLGTPMLHLNTGLTPIFVPSVAPSPFKELSPFFVQNENSPKFNGVQALYKMEDGSPVLECLEKNGHISTSKIEHNGQMFDFTPIASPINTFTLPVSHNKSVLSTPTEKNPFSPNSQKSKKTITDTKISYIPALAPREYSEANIGESIICKKLKRADKLRRMEKEEKTGVLDKSEKMFSYRENSDNSSSEIDKNRQKVILTKNKFYKFRTIFGNHFEKRRDRAAEDQIKRKTLLHRVCSTTSRSGRRQRKRRRK